MSSAQMAAILSGGDESSNYPFLSPETCGSDLKSVILKLTLQISFFFSINCKTFYKNDTEPHEWYFNMGSANGLVPSGT